MTIVIASLALLLAAAFGICCLLLAAFIGSLLYMVVLHHRLKHEGLEHEEGLLLTPLPPDGALPHVVVQVPSFNEGPVLRRGVEAAARLDWPRDRLHIQILDDSTDETAELARTVAAELRSKGYDVVALQRTERIGFKGGALHEAMQKTPHDYFAIFDVDYVPPVDFLRRCMRVFVAEPDTAFVQARFDFLNPHENALTEMQMVTLDAHLGIEQATRYWAGHPLPFNGTCGIWQRAAIEAGGGWKGDTVTEDLDLTYRGWVKGWRAVFLTSVAVPGELPADTGTWLRQQQRWQDGFRHVSMRMFPVILRSRSMSLAAKGAALLHLCMSLNQPVLLVGVVSGLLAGFLAPTLVPLLLAVFGVTLAWVLVCATTFLRAGHNFLRDGEMPPLRFAAVLLRFVGAQVATVGRSLFVHLKKAIAPAKPIVFDRTPKRGG
ncbi:glycosyltransferase [Enhydrobacter sp.]|jgi:cellulose synthase/poly-beta-1,6-N-acetylglucosamine synthase-like glycosyltransferase|uniref:glycosyltransferase n=1 Tax=Enhydrobacter sp. TaxID=1894999 RepID=UPI00263524DC|nr:glycosyltransferase [Enhydrobacter sp.]WIM13082.1 MAG: Glycosyltransferase [Enhydrobacter sp.]